MYMYLCIISKTCRQRLGASPQIPNGAPPLDLAGVFGSRYHLICPPLSPMMLCVFTADCWRSAPWPLARSQELQHCLIVSRGHNVLLCSPHAACRPGYCFCYCEAEYSRLCYTLTWTIGPTCETLYKAGGL